MHSMSIQRETKNSRAEIPPGTLYMLVLKTLAREPQHGYAIAQQIKRMSDDVLQVEEGSLYPALQRLLKDGLVTAEWGVSSTNRRVRVYTAHPGEHFGEADVGCLHPGAALKRVESPRVAVEGSLQSDRSAQAWRGGDERPERLDRGVRECECRLHGCRTARRKGEGPLELPTEHPGADSVEAKEVVGEATPDHHLPCLHRAGGQVGNRDLSRHLQGVEATADLALGACHSLHWPGGTRSPSERGEIEITLQAEENLRRAEGGTHLAAETDVASLPLAGEFVNNDVIRPNASRAANLFHDLLAAGRSERHPAGAYRKADFLLREARSALQVPDLEFAMSAGLTIGDLPAAQFDGAETNRGRSGGEAIGDEQGPRGILSARAGDPQGEAVQENP